MHLFFVSCAVTVVPLNVFQNKSHEYATLSFPPEYLVTFYSSLLGLLAALRRVYLLPRALFSQVF